MNLLIEIIKNIIVLSILVSLIFIYQLVKMNEEAVGNKQEYSKPTFVVKTRDFINRQKSSRELSNSVSIFQFLMILIAKLLNFLINTNAFLETLIIKEFMQADWNKCYLDSWRMFFT